MSSGTAARRQARYQDLLNLPDNVIGEIIEGELVVSPRPSGPSILAASFLGDELVGPFSKGRGGPGGWWILDEPEIELAHDINHVVPDLAGWKKERMPELPSGHVFTVVPDWICEVVSRTSERRDRVEKLNIYSRFQVRYYWLITPELRSLEAFRLGDNNAWALLGVFADNAKVRVAPFEAVEIDLSTLWAGTSEAPK